MSHDRLRLGNNGVVVYVIIRRTKVDHDIDPEKAIDHVLKYLLTAYRVLNLETNAEWNHYNAVYDKDPNKHIPCLLSAAVWI